MTRVDLITGFLGAGKTTFIHRYLHHLKAQRVIVIENEFGAIGVDAGFLKDEGCEIEDLSGVCMCCKGRGQFIAMLLDAASQGYDRVLVEPSGIYDVDEFFSVMADEAVARVCEIGCILTIVDSHLTGASATPTGYLMCTQLLAAGTVVLSKTQEVSSEQIARVIGELNALIAENGATRVLGEDVCYKDWESLTDADFIALQDSGFRHYDHRHQFLDHEGIYRTFITADYCLDQADLAERIRGLMGDARYGQVIRVKGYIRDVEKRWYQVNCTPDDLSIEPAPQIRRGVLVMIGQNLDEDALSGAFLPRVRVKS